MEWRARGRWSFERQPRGAVAPLVTWSPEVSPRGRKSALTKRRQNRSGLRRSILYFIDCWPSYRARRGYAIPALLAGLPPATNKEEIITKINIQSYLTDGTGTQCSAASCCGVYVYSLCSRCMLKGRVAVGGECKVIRHSDNTRVGRRNATILRDRFRPITNLQGKQEPNTAIPALELNWTNEQLSEARITIRDCGANIWKTFPSVEGHRVVISLAAELSGFVQPLCLVVRVAFHVRRLRRFTVAERLACSPPTKANRVQSPAGSLPNFRKWESCPTMQLVGGFFFGGFPVSPAFSFGAAHTQLTSPSSSLTMSYYITGENVYQINGLPNLPTESFFGAVVTERLDCSSPTKVKRVQSPAGPLPDFRKWKLCRTMPLVRGFSRGSLVSPALHSGAATFSPHFVLIGSQDLVSTCLEEPFDVRGMGQTAPFPPPYRQPYNYHRLPATSSSDAALAVDIGKPAILFLADMWPAGG
ncbi:hypothetical protein PR048_027434 [Dryococelus australis]|uniref:Uncharacterized protein n=1 Tax=Dryococelus australis TaxID=614101 RepID=A0ABQ9GFG4_9NEOP|nr:hypothetical protein PR048_027434 [Dryococelus australis]